MRRRRVVDGLVGALVAVTVLALAALALLWLANEPAGHGARTPPALTSPAQASPAPSAGGPPADLGVDETWLGDLRLDAGTVVTPDSLLRDVRAVGRDTRAGPSGLVAGSLAVQATVPFEVVAEQVGEGVTVRAAGSQATVLRTVELAGRQLPVEATGTVEVVDGRLVLEPRSIDVGGPGVLSRATAGVVRRFVTIEHTVQGLPEGLELRDVRVRDDGFRASLRGTDVRLDS